MSGAQNSLPPEIGALMQQFTVVWEAAASTDGYGQQSFGEAVELKCWSEQRSYLEGYEMNRGQDTWPIVPTVTLYFDGSDPNVQQFTLNDRFTIPGYPVVQRVQPSQINPFFGPDFDAVYPWVVTVNISLK